MDTVKVDPETFGTVAFMGCRGKDEWNENKNAPKVQKVNKDGVPVWRIQVAVTNWRGRAEMLAVSLAAQVDPGDELTVGEPVAFDGLLYGVTPKREGGGFTVWMSADSVRSLAQVESGTSSRPVQAVS